MSGSYIKGSQLNPALLLSAYRQGYFPMAQGQKGRVGFYAHDPRAMLPLDDRFTVRRSLRQIIRRQEFDIRFNTHTASVVRACSRHGELTNDEIWLSEAMIECYSELARMGQVHSVECFRTNASNEQELVGGLYGVSMGGLFCGESMFSRAPFASQIALVALVEHLRTQGFIALDAQMPTPHLKQFGLYELSHDKYLALLEKALELHPTF